MEYNKKLLGEWSQMEDWGTYLDRNGGLNKFSSKEGFDFLEREYYGMVKKRIKNCKELLNEHSADPFLFYVIAELFDRCNEDESPAHLYKRHVRYYALKVLEIEPNFASAKGLLKKVDKWIEFIGGERDDMPELGILFKKGRKKNY